MARSLSHLRVLCSLAMAAPGLWGGFVRAADPLPSVALRGFTPSTDSFATLFLEPTATPGPGNITMGAWLSAAHRPLILRERSGAILARPLTFQASLDPTFNLGVGTRGAVGFTLPVLLGQTGRDSAAERNALGGRAVPTTALGDGALTGKVSFLPPGEFGGLGLAAVGRLTLPTGARTGGAGEGAVTSELRLLGEFRVLGLTLQATGGWKIRTVERTFAGSTWGNEVPWGFGLAVKPQMFGIDAEGHWTWGVEAHGSLPAGPSAMFTNAALAPTYTGATVRYEFGDFHVLAGAEAALTDAIGAPMFRFVSHLGWSPRNRDRDHDGIPDDVDECVGLAEDRDGFQDTDGCPELDNDEDGVLDPDDKCPNEKEDEDGYQDTDGCPEPGDGKGRP